MERVVRGHVRLSGIVYTSIVLHRQENESIHPSMKVRESA